jgi:hypothetical protein
VLNEETVLLHVSMLQFRLELSGLSCCLVLSVSGQYAVAKCFQLTALGAKRRDPSTGRTALLIDRLMCVLGKYGYLLFVKFSTFDVLSWPLIQLGIHDRNVWRLYFVGERRLFAFALTSKSLCLTTTLYTA